MTRLTSGIVFYFLYFVIYMSPFIFLMFLDERLNINVSSYIDTLGSWKQIMGFIYLVYALLVPGYRAKLASDAYGDRDMKFWEAHSVSGTIFRTHLCFLPVIGKFFETKK